jgi:hypothetical protein
VNQDFILVATPATARRLLVLQHACRIAITDDIRRLAEQDRLDPSVFDSLVCPFDLVKYTIGQFLLDCDLRAVIQVDYHPEINPIFLLNIVRLTKPQRVIIVTDRRRMWHNAASALDLMVDVGSAWLLDTADRHSVVIYDPERGTRTGLEVPVTSKISHYMREFAHFIVFHDRQGFECLAHWSQWASLLFPSMPHPLLPRMIKDVPADWHSQPLSMFAPLYNTCIFPNLITVPSIKAALQDSYVQARLNNNMSLLNRL